MYRSIKGSTVAGAAAAVAGAFSLCTSAHAQTKSVPVQYPIAVKLGIAIPTDSSFSSNPLFDAGLSYDLGKTTTDKPVIYQVYGDYFGKSSANVFGIGLSAQFMLGNALSPTKPYVGVGLGDYIDHVTGSSSKSNFGGKVFAGYDFTQNVFGEVDYDIVQKVNDVTPGAIGIRVGYRF